MFRTLTESGGRDAEGNRNISPFRAFSISAASRVGTANIAGVALAIDPPQVVIWTVTDAEIGLLRYNENLRAAGYGGRQTADLGALWLPLGEALGPFEGSISSMPA